MYLPPVGYHSSPLEQPSLTFPTGFGQTVERRLIIISKIPHTRIVIGIVIPPLMVLLLSAEIRKRDCESL
jgi:hypothetical protein